MKKKEIEKIRITYILPTLDFGGAERFFVDLIKNLDLKKFEPSLLLYKKSGPWQKELDDLGIEVRQINKKYTFDIFNFIKICRELRRLKPQIVHTQLGADIYGVLAARLVGVKKVVSTEVNINSKETKLYNLVKRISLKFVNRVIAVSEAVREDAKRRYGVKAKKLELIYNGIVINNFPLLPLKTEEERLARKPLGLSRKRKVSFIIGTIGRLEEQKGHKYLIRAFKKANLKNAKLLIAAEGSLRPALERQVTRLKLKSQVELVGQVKASDFYKEIDAFVLPSLWEGMGIVLVEAALSGRPVLFNNIPGANEVLNNDNAWPLKVKNEKDWAQAMINIHDNYYSPETALKVLKARREVLERFDIKLIAKEHQDLYDNLLKI
ncbi:MAG: glycosyltransferase [Bacteroidales bacterium]|nr:glycosyltransferase [Bacteroidales bacterium]